jgi:hypothetical protein
MKKILSLIPCALLLLLGCFAGGLLPPPTAHAQLSPNWPPVGTKWVYNNYATERLPEKPNIIYTTHVENECVSDTTINDTSYRLVKSYIRFSKSRKLNEVYEPFFLRADSHRVYMRSYSSGTKEAIIQDYSLKDGDTLLIPQEVFYLRSDPPRYIYGKIIKKPDTVINGITRRRYYLDRLKGFTQFNYHFNFIEGIGPLETANAINVILDRLYYSRNIRCCIEPGKHTVHFRSDTNCLALDSTKRVSRSDDLARLGLELYPNPAIDYLTIKGLSSKNDYHFALVSTTGRIIALPKPQDERMELPDLPEGIYLLQIKNPEGALRYSTKIVIQN